MKNKIDYDSLKTHSWTFSFDKFFESDAPGTLSWINMDADDLSSDALPTEEFECHSVALPLADNRLNKQWLRLSASLRSVQTSQLKLLTK